MNTLNITGDSILVAARLAAANQERDERIRQHNYALRSAAAATSQGLDPITSVLRDHDIKFEVENTGGFCMVVAVYLNLVDRPVFVFTRSESGILDRPFQIVHYSAQRDWDCEDGSSGEPLWVRDIDHDGLNTVAELFHSIQTTIGA